MQEVMYQESRVKGDYPASRIDKSSCVPREAGLVHCPKLRECKQFTQAMPNSATEDRRRFWDPGIQTIPPSCGKGGLDLHRLIPHFCHTEEKVRRGRLKTPYQSLRYHTKNSSYSLDNIGGCRRKNKVQGYRLKILTGCRKY